MNPATEVPHPNGHHVPAHRQALRPTGIYTTPPGSQCEHVDPDRAGEPGFDEDGRCITRVCSLNTSDFCFIHQSLKAEQVRDALVGIARVMRERQAVAM